MRPLRLYLKNFLSYGEKGTEIDFSPYHTLLLTGKNGAGKSSILDAILWVLWGQTRTGGDNDIMHHGASDMEVRLDFSVRDHPYRVIRKRSKKGKSFVSVVELQSLTEPITLLTDATISKTQESINRLIGLDYELLINSAFLRQGEAQEFTKKSPSKRKIILASMLGLDQYVLLHEQAKEEKKKIDTQLASTQLQKDHLENELMRKEQELAELEKNIIQDREQEVAEALTKGRQQLQVLEKAIHLQREREGKMQALQAEHERLLGRVNTSTQKKKTMESTLLQIKTQAPAVALADIDDEQLIKLETHYGELQQIKLKITELKQSEQHINSLLSQEQVHWRNRRQEISQETAFLQEKISSSNIAKNDFTELAEKAEKSKETLSKKQIEFLKITEDIARIEQSITTITSQGNEIKKKKEKLTNLEHQCPLCEQNINDQHKHDIQEKYDKERNVLVEEFKVKNKELEQIQIKKKALDKEIISLRKIVDQIPHLQELILATQQIEALMKKDKALEKEFEQQKKTIEKEISLIQSQKNDITFSEDDLHAAQKELERLREIQKQAKNQQDIQIQLATLQKEIALHDAILKETEKEKSVVQKTLIELQALRVSQSLEKEHGETLQSIHNLEKEIASINNFKTIIQHMRSEQEELLEQKKRLEKNIREYADREESLAILAEAFSHKGIPSMLIEEAIPRLEQYANEVLSFLSENTMTIRLSLTRPSKTDRDAQIETLDILIGDTFGTRAYELFSGGEAFRIDIALRLALTKLLTEQTGGQIEFLVIDEGFGSQDDSGKDNIVQIIHKLENLFRLIILITHVDTLKETFPDRLIVRKGPQGSEIFMDQDN